MMPSWAARSEALTWLTTSGIPGSIRHAFELSITVQPCATACGASSRETSAPAENSAMSTPSKASGVASCTATGRPATGTVIPAERPDARSRSSAIGKARSSRTEIIVRPTTPVAPTTATVRGRVVVRDMAPLLVDGLAGTARVYQRAPGLPGARARRRMRAGPLTGPAARSALGEVPLHGGLAGQVDPALAVDVGDDNHHLVAHRDHVLDGRDVVVGQLADTDQTLLAGQDLHEGAEGHEAGHGAQVQGADLDLAGEGLDPVDRLAGVLAGDGGDLHGAVVLDVDLRARLLLDLPDHGAR